MNKFAEACSLWGELGDSTYSVQSIEQLHRGLYLTFIANGQQTGVVCTFRDLSDEVPEVIGLMVDQVEAMPSSVMRLNLKIWNHFVPETE